MGLTSFNAKRNLINKAESEKVLIKMKKAILKELDEREKEILEEAKRIVKEEVMQEINKEKKDKIETKENKKTTKK